jgi:hypothetical protein
MPDDIQTAASDPAPAGETGGDMHIHKPKAVGSLREFLSEIGVIVVGIVIALGGEQAVEAMHRAQEAHATEGALREEVGANLMSAAGRVMVGACLKDRLVGLSQSVSQGGEWRASPLPFTPPGIGDSKLGLPQVYIAPFGQWNDASWQAVLASGGVAHMGETQIRSYGQYYRYIAILRAEQEHEGAPKSAIEPLAYDEALSPDKRVEMQTQLAVLDRANFETVGWARQFIERARRDGLQPDPARLEATYQRDSSVFGACVHRLGSTADALPPDPR